MRFLRRLASWAEFFLRLSGSIERGLQHLEAQAPVCSTEAFGGSTWQLCACGATLTSILLQHRTLPVRSDLAEQYEQKLEQLAKRSSSGKRGQKLESISREHTQHYALYCNSDLAKQYEKKLEQLKREEELIREEGAESSEPPEQPEGHSLPARDSAPELAAAAAATAVMREAAATAVVETLQV